MGYKYNTKHGYAGNNRCRLYNTWLNIKQRCNNPKNPRYKNYGGRGIEVCEEWANNFISFKNWAIKNNYNDNLTIDRVDVNGNYEPSNCRWISNKTQQNNRTNNRIIEFNGERKTLKEWSETLNIKYNTLQKRLNKGWAIEVALTLPIQKHRKGDIYEVKSTGIFK
ncbi:hypothetical protein LPC27_03930 [Paraclostridium bifermentans]|uniref:hypothetical protein n=1 Tax=Paraclostridium bifermentans TaxID=1490 RepID=UPI00038CC838|nr:hypothetical protein [Paraclostridium bifermentans]EQK46950.1 hypothetical protein C671_1179 [[Clostridium] bifermentans ATCC 19299] [Paraclostridium bifermentans ATCC 19299]MCE9674903.1 hypothetical protein [Paraclostridium bifermentans]